MTATLCAEDTETQHIQTISLDTGSYGQPRVCSQAQPDSDNKNVFPSLHLLLLHD